MWFVWIRRLIFRNNAKILVEPRFVLWTRFVCSIHTSPIKRDFTTYEPAVLVFAQKMLCNCSSKAKCCSGVFVACYDKKCWMFGCRQFSYFFSSSPSHRFTLKSYIKLWIRKKIKTWMEQEKMRLTNSNGLLEITPQILSELGDKTQRSSQKLYFPLFHAYFWSNFKIRLLSSDFYLTRVTQHTYFLITMVNKLL